MPTQTKKRSKKNKNGVMHLLELVGEESLKVQFLTRCMTNITTNKKNISKITFETEVLNANQVAHNDDAPVGVIVWIPRQNYQQAVKEMNANANQ